MRVSCCRKCRSQNPKPFKQPILPGRRWRSRVRSTAAAQCEWWRRHEPSAASRLDGVVSVEQVV